MAFIRKNFTEVFIGVVLVIVSLSLWVSARDDAANALSDSFLLLAGEAEPDTKDRIREQADSAMYKEWFANAFLVSGVGLLVWTGVRHILLGLYMKQRAEARVEAELARN